VQLEVEFIPIDVYPQKCYSREEKNSLSYLSFDVFENTPIETGQRESTTA
jgi:hypothetical protein